MRIQPAVDRRNILRLATSVAGMSALPRWAWAGSTPRHNPFGLGVASGDPTSDGMVLWTRLLPAEPGAASSPLTVRWEVADDDRFLRIVQRGTATALPELAHSVHVELAGLAPDRWYHYRFLHGDAVSPTGRTRTAPAAGQMPARLRLAFASCQNWEHGHYAAWHHLVQDAPDLVLFLGDYIYEYTSPADTSGLARVQTLRHATTLADFRDRYALYKSDPQLQAAHAACPWGVVWDDHEVQNDYAGANGRGDDPAAFLALRSAAWQAFYEHMPLRAASLGAGHLGTQGLALHRRLAWGQLAHIHLLDMRQHRDVQACRRTGARSAGAVRPEDCAALAAPSRTLLGTAQERWLDTGLAQDARQQARWSVLAQTTLFSPRAYPSGLRATDTWDGYPAARQRLLQSIAGHAPRNTVVLAATSTRTTSAACPPTQNGRTHRPLPASSAAPPSARARAPRKTRWTPWPATTRMCCWRAAKNAATVSPTSPRRAGPPRCAPWTTRCAPTAAHTRWRVLWSRMDVPAPCH